MELGSRVLSAAISPTSSTVSGVQSSLRTLGHRAGGQKDLETKLSIYSTWGLGTC